jgi:hypothetical protein
VDTNTTQKVTKLLAGHRPGTPFLAGWLEAQGVSRELQHSYLRSGWLESLGSGAFRRTGDEVTWLGAVATLQSQAGAAIYPGALTALALQGFAHYARMGAERVFLFSPPRATLPAWFRNHDWGVALTHHKTSQLPPDLGLQEDKVGGIAVQLSSPERAALECLLLAPDEIDLAEMRELFAGLAGLRPRLVQSLLEQCGSVKAKRLLLWLADLADSPWRKRLDRSRINLGRGHRRLVDGGVYVAEYELTVPGGLAAS